VYLDNGRILLYSREETSKKKRRNPTQPNHYPTQSLRKEMTRSLKTKQSHHSQHYSHLFRPKPNLQVLHPQHPTKKKNHRVRTLRCNKLIVTETKKQQQQGFTLLSGSSHLKSYVDTTTTDSGQPLTRSFCGECGSNLFAFTPLLDSIVSVAAGTLDGFEEWRPGVEQ
jgi:hypothetical protein